MLLMFCSVVHMMLCARCEQEQHQIRCFGHKTRDAAACSVPSYQERELLVTEGRSKTGVSESLKADAVLSFSETRREEQPLSPTYSDSCVSHTVNWCSTHRDLHDACRLISTHRFRYQPTSTNLQLLPVPSSLLVPAAPSSDLILLSLFSKFSLFSHF